MFRFSLIEARKDRTNSTPPLMASLTPFRGLRYPKES